MQKLTSNVLVEHLQMTLYQEGRVEFARSMNIHLKQSSHYVDNRLGLVERCLLGIQ